MAGAVVFLACGLHAANARAAGKVVVIGEQSTHSGHPPTGAGMEWPDLLRTALGAAYTVENDADPTKASVYVNDTGATPAAYGGSFMGSTGYTASHVAPDIVVVGPWGEHDLQTATANALPTTQARFQADYEFLVSSYLKLANKPKVLLCTPLLLQGTAGNVTQATRDFITNAVLPAVKAVAAAHGLTVVDLYPALPATDFDADGHLNTLAAEMIVVDLVKAAITSGAGTTGAAGTGGGTDAGTTGAAGTGGSTDAGTTGAAGTTGTTTGTAGTTGTTTGAAGTTGSTTGTAGTTGTTTGAAGTAGTTTGAAGTAGTATGAAGTTGTTGSRGSSGGCAVGGAPAHARSLGGLSLLFMALAFGLPAWSRRRRAR